MDYPNRRNFLRGLAATAAGLVVPIADRSSFAEPVFDLSDDLRPSPNGVTTAGFEKLAIQNPWMVKARRSVAQVSVCVVDPSLSNEHFSHVNTFNSSAVLLDQNSIVFCEHQLVSHSSINTEIKLNFNNVFFPTAVVDYMDEPNDVAFATLQHQEWESNRLLSSVERAQIPYHATQLPANLIAIGWIKVSESQEEYLLHAIEGSPRSFDIGNYDGGALKCKISANMLAIPGMSGGGIFCDGKLLGIITGIGHLTANTGFTVFTPIDFIEEVRYNKPPFSGCASHPGRFSPSYVPQ